jgi:uncharacterized protein YndB with AHSA1/START domain
VPECRIDLKVGGRYLVCERAPNGRLLWITGTYREVVVPERIVYTLSFADSNGNIVHATQHGLSAELPLESLITVTFQARGGKTAVTVVHAGVMSEQIKNAYVGGWGEGFDKLTDLLGAAVPTRRPTA